MAVAQTFLVVQVALALYCLELVLPALARRPSFLPFACSWQGVSQEAGDPSSSRMHSGTTPQWTGVSVGCLGRQGPKRMQRAAKRHGWCLPLTECRHCQTMPARAVTPHETLPLSGLPPTARWVRAVHLGFLLEWLSSRLRSGKRILRRLPRLVNMPWVACCPTHDHPPPGRTTTVQRDLHPRWRRTPVCSHTGDGMRPFWPGCVGNRVTGYRGSAVIDATTHAVRYPARWSMRAPSAQSVEGRSSAPTRPPQSAPQGLDTCQ